MERLTFDDRFCDIEKVWERLKDYEDTGLTPEQCAEYAKADRDGRYIVLRDAEQDGVKRIRELAKADKEGRVVVLPCKVGDTIYYTREGRAIVEPIKVRTFFVGDPTRRGEILHLRMIRTDMFDVSMDALGKTVFLTREEAERALQEMEGKA